MIADCQSLVEDMPPVHPWETFSLTRLENLRPDFTPHNFQYFSVYRAICQRIFVIGLQTGLGKSLCSYLAYFYYKSKFPNTKFLVFTSNSGVLQFRNELDKFFDHDCVAVAIHKDMNHPKILMAGKKNPTRVTYAGARKLAYEGFAKPSGDGSVDLLVMNYAVARRDVKQILSAIKKLNRKGVKVFSIFDEATNFKSLSADTHHVVHAIAGQSERVLGLPAT